MVRIKACRLFANAELVLDMQNESREKFCQNYMNPGYFTLAAIDLEP